MITDAGNNQNSTFSDVAADLDAIVTVDGGNIIALSGLVFLLLLGL